MKDIRSAKDLKSKKVLLRCDLNVPVKDGKILDDFRLVRTLSTIDFLREKDAKIILIGHIGRDSKNSLAPTHEFFKKYFPVNFTQEVIGSKTSSAIDSMKDGEIVLLENLRRHEGETENDDFSFPDFLDEEDWPGSSEVFVGKPVTHGELRHAVAQAMNAAD